MGFKQGKLLENTIKKIFDKAGFKTNQNIRIKGYEIDVLANYAGWTIAIECKERQGSNLIVRNLIHEWAGKNEELNINTILLVIYGKEVTAEDRTLAKRKNISLWNANAVEHFLNLTLENSTNLLPLILESLEINTKEVENLRLERKKIAMDKERNWKPDIDDLKDHYEFSAKSKGIAVLVGEYSADSEDDRWREFNRDYGALSKGHKLTSEELDAGLSYLRELEAGEIFKSLRVLVFPFELDETDVKVAEKNGIRHIVCKRIKLNHTGFLRLVLKPAFDISKVKANIIRMGY